MSYIRCDGTIDTNLVCSTGWITVPDNLVEGALPDLTIAEGSDIAGAILLLWATAFGARFLYKFLIGMNPGRF